MAGEKTEKATPKKRRDSRKEGNVLKSQEINSSITMISAILVLAIFWPKMMNSMVHFITTIFTNGFEVYGALDSASLEQLFLFALQTAVMVVGPVILLIMVAGVFSNYLQVGFLFVPKTILPKTERINILKGLKRLFSITTITNLIKSLLKIGACCFVAYVSLKPLILETVSMLGAEINYSIEYGANKMIWLAVKLCLLMVSISILDYIFKWFENEKKLKMSKQEVKDEYKNTEGNPEIKSRIRSIQTRMAMSRMMQQVPEADVVITNPTHFAVVLKYTREKHNAPIVIAKGADRIAQRIKEIAKQNEVEIVESKELARSLYSTTEIGEQIPPEFFNAVAEILAYIYALKDKKRYKKR